MSHTTLSHHNTCMRNTVTFYIVQAGELCCWAREESTEVSEYGGACCLDVEQCLASGTANRNHTQRLCATLGVGMTGCYIGCGDDRVLYWVWGWQGVILGVGMTGCYMGVGITGCYMGVWWQGVILGVGMTGCYIECGNDRVIYTLSHMEHCHFWYHQKVTWSALVVLTFYASTYVHTCKSIHVLWITLHGFKCT